MSNTEQTAEKLAIALNDRFGEKKAAVISACLPGLPLGCHWGFFEADTFAALELTPKDIEGFAFVYPLRNGYLVSMEYNNLINIVQNIIPLFTPETILEASKTRDASSRKLVKTLKKAGAKIGMGFYSLNEAPTITIKGTVYPSFNVPLPVLANAAQECGFGFRTSQGVITPNQALQSGAQFLAERNLAPSGNALMVELVRI